MPVVKGGVWTNIEDEILKASVSKYGLNQWARVSSLLARKTPKQCKARWTEWLDPSIKKIEWSRDEDERLLHLAKIMPTQWRSIAPIVGRTANQCLDRYQRLLDEAEAREAASELGQLTGPDGGETRAPAGEDLRRTRPGELDMSQETRPAKPDTIDLDEDEKEMLSEARARLANTQGKKAKRKARERQQEESRRLAALSKRRELKTAGINIKIVTRKPGQMDYNADIPFEKKPVPGFHDTTEEQARNEFQRAGFDPRKTQLATKRKGVDGKPGEDGAEPTDRKRRKNEKEAPSAAFQAAIKAGQMQRIREAERSSKRRALVLPEPQISEAEMDEIIKMGRAGEEASQAARLGDNDATRGLVGSYSGLDPASGASASAVAATPIRTPMAAPQDDHIANELRNIRAEARTQSVLLGGENPDLIEGRGSTGYRGAAPDKHVVSTPNPLATPLRQQPPYPGATPGQQTPMRTPRDPLALNSGATPSMVSSASPSAAATPRDARTAQLALRGNLRHGLSSLPKPKAAEFELVVPEDKHVPSAESDADGREEDAEDRDRRARAAEEALDELERRRRTQAVQRGLPRPVAVDVAALLARADALPTPEQVLVGREAALLMAHDAAKFPAPGSKAASSRRPVSIEKFDDHALDEARQLVLAETAALPDVDTLDRVFNLRNMSSVLMGMSGYEEESAARAGQTTAGDSAFNSLRESLLASADRDAKQETKLDRLLGGYMKRQRSLSDKITEAAETLTKTKFALSGFLYLAELEEVAIQRRLETVTEEVGFVSRREREAQDEYRLAKEELAELIALGGEY